MAGSSGRGNPSPRWIRFIPIRYQQRYPLALQAPLSCGALRAAVRPETTWTEDDGKVVISHTASLSVPFLSVFHLHVWELRSVPLCPSPLRTLFMSLSPSVRARVSVHVVILEIQLDRREESGAAGAFRARRSGFDVRTGVASAVCVNRLVV
ncbi:hypothetical protein B296_00000011 [Ensete ventricosum]|uniref:Uncharacterized protein n=1 Tax=Ensete ventricosum TaxID=4639 RepID=A0A427ALW2_ENSVE|nr:hypothetical protein B296_00000011 [Ensete ventricosum]